MICETGIDVSNKTKGELRNLILGKKCAEWFLKSTPVLGRCVPSSVPKDLLEFHMTESELKEIQRFVKAILWGERVLNAAISTRYGMDSYRIGNF